FSLPNPATPHFYTLSLHDALPIFLVARRRLLDRSRLRGRRDAEPDVRGSLLRPHRSRRGSPRRLRPVGRHVRVPAQALLGVPQPDRKSTRLNSSHLVISYAVFCLK